MENNIDLEKLAREHFPEDTSIHIDMRKIWIERYMSNNNEIVNKIINTHYADTNK